MGQSFTYSRTDQRASLLDIEIFLGHLHPGDSAVETISSSRIVIRTSEEKFEILCFSAPILKLLLDLLAVRSFFPV